MFSESGDRREKDWVRLASQSEVAETNCCPCCEEDLTRASMFRYLETPDNVQYAGKSGDPKLKEMFDKFTAGGLTLGCPCCRHQFPRSRFAADFKRHIMTAKNKDCLKTASTPKDPVVLAIYNKIAPL